jgi:hypothetical protein
MALQAPKRFDADPLNGSGFELLATELMPHLDLTESGEVCAYSCALSQHCTCTIAYLVRFAQPCRASWAVRVEIGRNIRIGSKCAFIEPEALCRIICPTNQPVTFQMGINASLLVCLAFGRKLLRTKAG